MKVINESGMTFQIDENNCFVIEKHPLVTKGYKSSQNNKACEFVTFSRDSHVFVEAKKSAPRGSNGNIDDLKLNGEGFPDNWTAYDNYTTFLREISKKFIDSYSILKSICEGHHGENEKKNLDLASKDVNNNAIEFVLILNIQAKEGNTKLDSIANLRDALTNEMRPFLSIWHISPDSVKVLWPEQAHARYSFPSI